jgi:hypothetical protein
MRTASTRCAGRRPKALIQWFGSYHYRKACETHAPLFWESEPPPRFAHTPLANSKSAILSPIVCVIFNSVSDTQVPYTLRVPAPGTN